MLGALWAVYRAEQGSRLAAWLTPPLRADVFVVRIRTRILGKVSQRRLAVFNRFAAHRAFLLVVPALLSRKLPQSERERVNALPTEKLAALLDAVLDFTAPADVVAWLDGQQPTQ